MIYDFILEHFTIRPIIVAGGVRTPKVYMKTTVSWYFIIKVLITNTNNEVLP